MILQACVFEIVTDQVDQVPVPEWAFKAVGQPVEKRNFRYAEMLYPDGRRKNQWGRGASVPDVSRPETQALVLFPVGVVHRSGHRGDPLRSGRDHEWERPELAHWSRVLSLVRAYAAGHARRHMVLCDAHVPSGGLVQQGRLLLDFHSFPLRIKEGPRSRRKPS